MAEHNEFGKLAEQKTVAFLIQNNYQILEINWRSHKAEIDIISLKNDVLVIVEVKARQIASKQFGVNPQDAVNAKKKRLLIQATDDYIQEKGLDYEVRFDIISVLHNNGKWEINHIENAFSAFET